MTTVTPFLPPPVRVRPAVATVRVLTAGVATTTGRVRRNNEDTHLTSPDLRLFAVADGIGGRPGGEVASRKACAALDAAVRTSTDLPAAVLAAHQTVQAAAKKDAQLAEMGTTLVAVHFATDLSSVTIAHVGDSRCYLYRPHDGCFALLTRDHSAYYPEHYRFALTRALGCSDGTPDVKVRQVDPDCAFLLCSDGVHEYINEDAIVETFADHWNDENQAPTIAERLCDLANEAGGGDNATAVVVSVRWQT